MASESITHEEWMRLAIQEAEKGRGTVEPNPVVGALIVENNELAIAAHHKEYGGPHAERLAIEGLGRKPAADAVMYVTLEPCSTHGRTGACTERIIKAGISKVVIGAIDPNPAHRGNGIKILESAGISVEAGILEAECTALNPTFNEQMNQFSQE